MVRVDGIGWEEALAMGGNASISAQRREDSIPDTAAVPLWERTQGMVGSERRPACPCSPMDLECHQDRHPGRRPSGWLRPEPPTPWETSS